MSDINIGADLKDLAGDAWSYGKFGVHGGLAVGSAALDYGKDIVLSPFIHDFVGISETGLNDVLIPAIREYCNTISERINAFNETAAASQAFKGEVADAVTEFVGQCKAILSQTVAKMEQEIRDAQSGYEQWKAGSQSVASSTAANISEVRAAGNSVNLD